MKQNSNLTVALYERLSHDDEQQGESFSISNQKLLLETYAREHGMNNYKQTQAAKGAELLISNFSLEKQMFIWSA